MKIKKILTVILAACVSCMMFIGCTSEQTPTFSSFDKTFESFESGMEIVSSAELEATVNSIGTGSVIQGKTMKRIIIEIPELGKYTVSCLCDDETDAFYNVNLTGVGSPYFTKISGIILDELGISGDVEKLKESLSYGISEEDVTNYAEMDGFEFSLVKSDNEYSLTVHP